MSVVSDFFFFFQIEGRTLPHETICLQTSSFTTGTDFLWSREVVRDASISCVRNCFIKKETCQMCTLTHTRTPKNMPILLIDYLFIPFIFRFPSVSGPSSILTAVLTRPRSWLQPYSGWPDLLGFKLRSPFGWSWEMIALRLMWRAFTLTSLARYDVVVWTISAVTGMNWSSSAMTATKCSRSM